MKDKQQSGRMYLKHVLSFSKHLLNVYDKPGTVLRPGHTAEDKTKSCSYGPYLLEGDTEYKQVKQIHNV